jgi:HlyD family secretion protein
MVEQNSNLFREQSLERLSSPERLDQLMQIVGFKSWIPLTALGSLVLTAILWSIFGRIPVTVEGRGVLIYPQDVVPLQSTSSGQVLTLKVKPGDTVKKRDLLATVDQVDLQKQLQLQRSKLAELEAQSRDNTLVQQRRNALDKRAIQQQRETLQESLKIVQGLTPVLREKGLVSIQRDRQNLQWNLQTTQELLPTFKQRWESREAIFREGAISADTVLQAQQDYLDAKSKVDQAQSQLKQLDLKEADALRQYLSNVNEIEKIQSQLREQDAKEADIEKQDLESSTTRKKEIQDVQRQIAQLEQQLGTNSEIRSQYNGRVLEMTVLPGQVIQTGTRLGNIAAEKPNSKLMSVTYFAVGDGKKIQPRMALQITPQTVKRERFGGILGHITNVSSFPISKEAAASVVGNSEVVSSLLAPNQEGLMQVFAELEPDSNTFSGYKWSSSKGPQLKVTPGTTTTVQVQVEERRPITFVLPILRSASGIF